MNEHPTLEQRLPSPASDGIAGVPISVDRQPRGFSQPWLVNDDGTPAACRALTAIIAPALIALSIIALAIAQP
jgi:hypothetical protein